MHATFQRDENNGKRSRLRQATVPSLHTVAASLMRYLFGIKQTTEVSVANMSGFATCEAAACTLDKQRHDPRCPILRRSAGWWLVDEPAYYSDGNFMSYDNGVHAFIAAAEKGFRNMANFHKHMLGAAYQMAAFQHAAAIARRVCMRKPRVNQGFSHMQQCMGTRTEQPVLWVAPASLSCAVADRRPRQA